MSDTPAAVSKAFMVFMEQAPAHAQATMQSVQALDAACALDEKTGELAYLAVLAALRMESGVPFHVKAAKAAGATREEIISAVLLSLPAVGLTAIQVLPAALAAYDE